MVSRIEKIKLLKSPEKDDVKGLAKLNFFPDDDLVEYKGESKKVKGKGRALLTMFSKSKGIPFTASEIARKCNSTINNSFHYFRSDKDIYDTIEHLKKKLKVKKSLIQIFNFSLLYRRPFVESTPLTLGSFSHATRKERASALNIASLL